MGGYAVHVANDRPDPLDATVTIRLSQSDRPVDGGQVAIAVPPHSIWTGDAETIIGHWTDVSYTYRFGPPAHDLVTAELRVEERRPSRSGAALPAGTGRRGMKPLLSPRQARTRSPRSTSPPRGEAREHRRPHRPAVRLGRPDLLPSAPRLEPGARRGGFRQPADRLSRHRRFVGRMCATKAWSRHGQRRSRRRRMATKRGRGESRGRRARCRRPGHAPGDGGWCRGR